MRGRRPERGLEARREEVHRPKRGAPLAKKRRTGRRIEAAGQNRGTSPAKKDRQARRNSPSSLLEAAGQKIDALADESHTYHKKEAHRPISDTHTGRKVALRPQKGTQATEERHTCHKEAQRHRGRRPQRGTQTEK